MRGDTDSATPHQPQLSEPARHGFGAAALALIGATALSGRFGSLFLLPLLASLIVVVRYTPPRIVLGAPAAAALLLLVIEAAVSDVGLRDVLAAVLLAASAAPAWAWRKEAARAHAQAAQLDDIMHQARRGHDAEAPAAVTELADLERALAAVAARLHAIAITLLDVDAMAGAARPRAGWPTRPRHALRLPGDPLGWVWEQGMRLRLEPTPLWAPERSIVIADRLRRDDTHGLLVTFAFDANAALPDDVAFDEANVYLRGLIQLQEARASAAADRRRIETLLKGLDRIPGELDLHALAADLCATAIAITDATGAAVGSWDGEQGRVIAVAGEDGGPRAGDVFAPPASELALAARADAMLVRTADTWSLGRTFVAHGDERWLRQPSAMAVLPLRNPGGVSGVLAVWSSRDQALDPESVRLLHALAPYAALHIEHAHAFGRMRENAERDPLTRLRNRRAFDEIFTGETMRFERYGRPLALLVLDLDHFKAINDQLGHEAGDEVLARMARIIEANIRDIDTAARFGGEEFVVLLPETRLAAAREVAERIRAATAMASIEWRGRPILVRVSIGVSACPECVAHPKELMRAADTALYQAKAAGRNRVV